MKSSRALPALPASVARALRKLGQDLSAARRRRRLTMALVAERAFISRTTLARVERGDAGVSMGIYATVLFVLGMTDRVGDLADPRTDALGLALEEERLPKRVRLPRKRKAGLLPNTEVEFELDGKTVRGRRAKTVDEHGRGAATIAHLRGRSTVRMSTDEIMALTRRA